MHGNELGDLAGDITMGIIAVIGAAVIFQLSYMVGAALSRRREGEPNNVEVQTHWAPPVTQGPLWQNSRIWEDHHITGQYGIPFQNPPMVEDPTLDRWWAEMEDRGHEDFQDPLETPENEVAWRIDRGRVYRID